MARPMLQFTRLDQKTPAKRDAETRRRDFDEIYTGFSTEAAGDQASRCEQCGIPFCHLHCPLANNIPDWLMLTAAGRLEEAYALSSSTNSMPEICGRICPQDRLCEGLCVLEQSRHRSVTIGAVERYITDTAWENGWVTPLRPVRELSQSVGIVGGGPGGLAAAGQLRKMGYQVTVYDRHDRFGGLLMYGIPGFKLEKDVVQRRIDHLAASGVTLKAGFEVGRDATLADLRQKHDAVLIATGVYKARALGLAGAETLQGVIKALDYLITANKVGLGDRVPAFEEGTLNAQGKKVVVIGGGDTAMDCLRTAIRQGASSVTCLYRRDRANMPGSQREVDNAIDEGVTFEWLSAPEALLGTGTVSGVQASRMYLGMADGSGRQTPKPLPGSGFTVEADLVIEALGFEPENMPTTLGDPDLAVGRDGTIGVDANKMSSIEGVFAAGDIVRGASLVVWAIRDGRDAAEGIRRYLETKAAGVAGSARAS
ncbi:NAD(P)-dependent oxidoreductase [Pararhodospirillum photometricum]|nr:NAD(P)-dependent oxidoreductase [Pararhodospirillum photometricum]